MRLAIITTHPIQYYAPVFQRLHKKLELKVFYTWGEKAKQKFDPAFGQIVEWDIPLLQGYAYEWINNIAPNPGSHSFKGIDNPELISQIKAWNPDALLVYGWAYKSHLKAIRHFKNKIPVYFRGDSTLLDVQSGFKTWLRSIVLKWVYRHIDHAFYVGSNSKAYFKKYGLKDYQLTFAPHAIDNERFAIDRIDEALKLRQELKISADDVLILFAGKLEGKKAPEILLDAFCSLTGNLSAHLLFVGNGHLEKQLKLKADGKKNIHFLSFQNQSFIPVVYQASDLFCLPSQGPGETWGLAVNEAMAAGKPVLVSDRVGCFTDLVIPNDTGQVFKAGNLNDITAKLMSLLKDKHQLEILGQHAKAKIADWSFDKQANVIIKTIYSQRAK